MTWKRIQTLFIALAAALTFAMLAFDMCYTFQPDETGELTRFSIKFTDNILITLLDALIIFICIFAIAVHKRQYLEGKLCILNIVLCVFYQLIILFCFIQFRKIYTFSIASVFPSIAAVLFGMAYHFISRDLANEMLGKAFAKRFPKKFKDNTKQ